MIVWTGAPMVSWSQMIDLRLLDADLLDADLLDADLLDADEAG